MSRTLGRRASVILHRVRPGMKIDGPTRTQNENHNTECHKGACASRRIDHFNLAWKYGIMVSAIGRQTLFPVNSVLVIPCTDNTEKEMVFSAPVTA